MNHRDPCPPANELEFLQSRFALQVVARLSDKAEQVPHDVSERLRFAREKAIARARVAVAERPLAAGVLSNGSFGATLRLQPGSGTSWWVRFGSLVPLAALVIGLMLIQDLHRGSQISAAAEVDAELLGDDVPVSAYGDPGFVEFLKTTRN
jgi:hypothetical protein